MNRPGTVTLQIESCLARLQSGEADAQHELMECAFDRLVNITERIVGAMVSPDKGLRASDVFQDAYLRLTQAIQRDDVNPQTAGEFLGLAARHIRFQVLDLLRATKRRKTQHAPDAMLDALVEDVYLPGSDDTEMWIRFLEAFEQLPEEERAVADLLWVWVEGKGGPAVRNMTQSEAAEVLGLSRDRVKDLWRRARIKIARQCDDFDPLNG